MILEQKAAPVFSCLSKMYDMRKRRESYLLSAEGLEVALVIGMECL